VGAVASVDCLDPVPSVLGKLDRRRFAVVQPPAVDVFDGALVRVAADGVEVGGLVVEGRVDPVADVVTGYSLYDAAISVSDKFSGTRLRHNVVQHNTLAVELGGSGDAESRVDHNCIRDNSWALANQRFLLTSARIHDNVTTRSRFLTWEIGWGYRTAKDVMVDHNLSREPGFAVASVDAAEDVVVSSNDIVATGARAISVQSSRRVSVLDNMVVPGVVGIFVGPGNEGVDVRGNAVTGQVDTLGGSTGVAVGPPGAVPATVGLVIQDNLVSGMRSGSGRGIFMGANAQPRGAVVTGNRLTENIDGMVLGPGNHRSTIANNIVVKSMTAPPSGVGFRTLLGARENTFTDNIALGHLSDARDEGLLTEGVTPTSNQWVRTTCVTDLPKGMICTPPAAEGSAG